MKTRMISAMLTLAMICSTTFFVKADQVKIRKAKNTTGGVRSILLDPSHLMVNQDNSVIHQTADRFINKSFHLRLLRLI